MVFAPTLALSALVASAFASPLLPRAAPSDQVACSTIASSISSASGVFYPGSAAYANDTDKWAPNSAQTAVCTVEPGTSADVSIIVKLLANTFTATKFNVKGGGHNSNVGFSSTTGVLISMRRMDEVIYNKAAGTVDVGAGNLWDNVYGKLDGTGVTVLGGRVSTVGVAGFVLGGGYSWFANKYGLSIDSVVSYEIVLANSSIVTVTGSSFPDIFFGLKGGFLNFGIVTKFIMTAYPIGQVWGGLINYDTAQIPATLAAVANFSLNNTDPNAQVVVSLVGTNKTTSMSMLIFYDGPAPGATFNQILALPSASKSVATSSFYENFLAVSPPFLNAAKQRALIGSPRIEKLSANLLNVSLNQILKYTATNAISSDFVLNVAIEPFIGTDIVRTNIAATAWPHSSFVSPMAINVFWDNASADATALSTLDSVRSAIESASVAEGQPPVASLFAYPNYSTADVPLSQMYGPNLARLQAIAATYDSGKFFARAGGIRFQ